MDERVRAAVIGGDEAITLVGVEEFDGSDDAHGILLLVCDAPRAGGQGPERQGKKEVGAAKRRRPSICDCSKADIGEGGRNCKFGGMCRASGILLAGVFDGEDFDGVERDAIDHDIVGRDNRFACAGTAAGAVHMGMVDQPFGGLLEQLGKAQCCRRVAVGNIVENIASVLSRLGAPDDVRHQKRFAALASMSARSSAMT